MKSSCLPGSVTVSCWPVDLLALPRSVFDSVDRMNRGESWVMQAPRSWCLLCLSVLQPLVSHFPLQSPWPHFLLLIMISLCSIPPCHFTISQFPYGWKIIFNCLISISKFRILISLPFVWMRLCLLVSLQSGYLELDMSPSATLYQWEVECRGIQSYYLKHSRLDKGVLLAHWCHLNKIPDTWYFSRNSNWFVMVLEAGILRE